jgi:phage terminase small subunit
MARKQKLTAKQERFVAEYLIDLNATAAAVRAGYAPKWADRQAHLLIEKNRVIADAIQSALKKRNERLEITADMVLRELARVAFSDARRLYNDDGSLKTPNELDDDTAAALAGIDTFEEFDGRGENRRLIGYTKKIHRWDKVKSLELLGKHLGLFPVNGRLQLTLPSGEETETEEEREGRRIARRLIIEEIREARKDIPDGESE